MPSIKDYNYCWGEHGAAGARRATSQKRWNRLGVLVSLVITLHYIPLLNVARYTLGLYPPKVTYPLNGATFFAMSLVALRLPRARPSSSCSP